MTPELTGIGLKEYRKEEDHWFIRVFKWGINCFIKNGCIKNSVSVLKEGDYFTIIGYGLVYNANSGIVEL
jgi:hypothetical protein